MITGEVELERQNKVERHISIVKNETPTYICMSNPDALAIPRTS